MHAVCNWQRVGRCATPRSHAPAPALSVPGTPPCAPPRCRWNRAAAGTAGAAGRFAERRCNGRNARQALWGGVDNAELSPDLGGQQLYLQFSSVISRQQSEWLRPFAHAIHPWACYNEMPQLAAQAVLINRNLPCLGHGGHAPVVDVLQPGQHVPQHAARQQLGILSRHHVAELQHAAEQGARCRPDEESYLSFGETREMGDTCASVPTQGDTRA